MCIAQEGAWNPSGADYSFPRTLLKSSEIETVKNTLSEPTFNYFIEELLIAPSAVFLKAI